MYSKNKYTGLYYIIYMAIVVCQCQIWSLYSLLCFTFNVYVWLYYFSVESDVQQECRIKFIDEIFSIERKESPNELTGEGEARIKKPDCDYCKVLESSLSLYLSFSSLLFSFIFLFFLKG